ncbi:hypothetical protein [Escherichia coli]|uniref:Uncharacterized protein n=1 Tax=Escherichia coli TaxID=562 RepID=A0ACC5U3R2_ECOLX|nr:hypothetical protein [Escherichia coli]MBT2808486.1 hypothetical protein [Escherichia coli]
MTRFAKNIICSMSLAASDFISFVFSLYLSLAILSVTLMDFENRVPENQIESWVVTPTY